MAVKVIMPILGLTMTEGKIARWLKNEGDYVKKGESLLEIATDKIVTEVESPGEGILVRIIHQKEAVVPVTKLIGIIAAEGENFDHLLEDGMADASVHEQGTATKPAEEEKQVAVPSQQQGGRLKVSPLAKRIASEYNLTANEMQNISGTGPEGRITKEDILGYIEQKSKTPAQAVAREKAVVPLTNLRRTIATRMKQSWETPHFYLEAEIDAGNLLEMRKKVNDTLKKDNISVSVTDLLVKTCAHVLSQHRYMNVSFSEDGIIYNGDINIGVAVAMDEGLIVPVIKNADKKGVRQISLDSKELIKKTKSEKLTMDDITGGTFTVSNLGMFSVDSFTAILNPPESAILAAGRIIDKPVVIEKEITVRPCMLITLGLDHRSIDGAQAAKFLSALKDAVENPYLLAL